MTPAADASTSQDSQPTETYPEETPYTTWAIPEDIPVPRDTLKMQIDIYQDSIVLRGHAENTVYTRIISADETADILTQHRGINTGLLPERTLWLSNSGIGTTTAIWLPPATWPVALQERPSDPPLRLKLPMPGLVFICPHGQAPWVFATKARPSRTEDQLFHAPAFNVFRDGRVCPGNHIFPQDPGMVPGSFFQSFFSPTADTRNRSKKHPEHLKSLWMELNGKRKYPLGDLVPSITVAEAMRLPTPPTHP